ncbi:ATP-dependent protease [Vibrio sp. SM6]|uniref:ATP-dependent protease n=1 Tax=Vibrio agarilyticus TaxID=2726741 RepID=A0A7X8YGL7_9VIBR|nr:LON peptidase substrate-binding domain-containing protein [Vibrio agarilyticus]NLS13118.1 ATP-dependent protease [Vibrio agarilyticus]
MSQLMLFPLSSTVLPGGRMKLRIFEPRYRRLVRDCCERDTSFGMCLVDKDTKTGETQLSHFGTMCRIIDFELLDDGLLGITVVGEQRFQINHIEVESDGLRVADVELLQNWAPTPFSPQDKSLSQHLKRVYGEFPVIAELYADCHFDDATWVAQRWMEILPLSKPLYEALVSSGDCQNAVAFLRHTIEEPQQTPS